MPERLIGPGRPAEGWLGPQYSCRSTGPPTYHAWICSYLYRHSKQEKSRQESLIHLVGIYHHTKMVRLVLPCMYHTFSTESQFYCGNISAKFLGFFVCTSLQ